MTRPNCILPIPRPESLLPVLLAATALTVGWTPTVVQAEDAPPSRVNALLNFEFSDQYLTPRGMIVHNDGLTFQPLVLGLFNVYKGDSFLTDVTLVGGFWNDFSSSGVSEHAPFNSNPKTHWVEIDPIAGISLGLGKQVKLGITYTAFNMEILDIPLSQHLEVKLSLDDSPWLKAFALNPYALFWQELDGKATAARVPFIVYKGEPGPPSSYYFELGIAPSYTLASCGLKLETPCRVLLPNKDFYGEYYAQSSTVGLYEVGLKGTLPLKFMPPGYGHWGFHAGFRYMNLNDDNVAGMQEFNAPGKATRDVIQFYCGLSAFF